MALSTSSQSAEVKLNPALVEAPVAASKIYKIPPTLDLQEFPRIVPKSLNSEVEIMASSTAQNKLNAWVRPIELTVIVVAKLSTGFG
jgi:hypothetical protein